MNNEGSVILACTCTNHFQDGRYGKGQRVHNFCKHPTTGDDMRGARCTVCARVKPL